MGDMLDKIKNCDEEEQKKEEAKCDGAAHAQTKQHLTEQDISKMSSEEKSAAKENFLMQFREANKMQDGKTTHTLNSVNFMKIWENYDKSKTGYLEPCEIDAFLKDLLQVQGEDTDPQTLCDYKAMVLSTFDRDGDGRMELADLAQLLPVEDNFIRNFPLDRSKMDRQQFDAIFKHYDVAGTGFIEENELVGLLKDLFQCQNQSLPPNDLITYAKAVMEIHDSDNDGRLSRDDLRLLLAHS